MNLTVLVGSCDHYSPLWENFQICFDRYWDRNTRNILSTESKLLKNITKTEIETHNTGNGNWGSRMLSSIGQIKTDFIFFILDDYFLDKKYPEGDIETYIDDMIKYDFDRLQISKANLQKYEKSTNTRYHRLIPQSDYLISMQPSIWKKSFLEQVLKPEYSPWDFEMKGTPNIRNSNYNIVSDNKCPKMYFNAVRRGFKKSKDWEEFRKKENLNNF